MTFGRFSLPERWLAPGVVLLLVLAALLAGRIGLQLGALHTARQDIADQEKLVAAYAGRTTGTQGAALVSAAPAEVPSEAAARIRKQALDAGLKVTGLDVLPSRPGGTNLKIVRLNLRALGDAASVDRFARWMARNADAVTLERLIMTAPQDGSANPEMIADIAVLAQEAGQTVQAVPL